MNKYMSGSELRQYLHISTRKMKYLMDNDYIPHENTGQATHKYRIRRADAKGRVHGMINFARVRFRDFPPMITVKDTAKCLGVCTKTIYIMIRHGDITAVKIGRRYIVSKESIKDCCKRYRR